MGQWNVTDPVLQKRRAGIGLGLLCLGGVSLASGAPVDDIHRGERVGKVDGRPPAASTGAAEPHTLFQTSTINAVLEGVYDGDMPVATLRQHGDFGLGTLN